MKHLFKFICCGNVDDGKSTLIGRLLLDTNNVKKDQIEDALKASHKNGSAQLEPAMLLDGLLDEREQQITIDVAHRYFDYNDIRFHILDCPGHEQYTKNMAIAAAEADTAIIVVDTTKGIKPQTLKHIEICDLFQLKNILICLTKTDLLPESKKADIINLIKTELSNILNTYNFSYKIIPVSAITGENTSQVIEFLYEQAINHSYIKQDQITAHILTSKLFKIKRYYYPTGSYKNKLKRDMQLTVLPQNHIVTITNVFENGTFNIAENIDISKGDCLTNTHVFVSNKIKHKTIWFEHPTQSMIFKHGANIRKVISLTPDLLELNDVIIFNNINEIKTNGFGIFIDEATKKTIGCAVFMDNKQDKAAQEENKTYIFTGSGIQKTLKIKQEQSHFFPSPVLIDEEKIKEIFFEDTVIDPQVLQKKGLELADYFNKNGQNVFYLTQKLIVPINSNTVLIYTGDTK